MAQLAATNLDGVLFRKATAAMSIVGLTAIAQWHERTKDSEGPKRGLAGRSEIVKMKFQITQN